MVNSRVAQKEQAESFVLDWGNLHLNQRLSLFSFNYISKGNIIISYSKH